MNKLTYLITFAVGAGVGVAATWQYFKQKYERIADEEIQSVKELFGKLDKNAKEEAKEEPVGEKTENKSSIVKGQTPAMKNYSKTLKDLGYGKNETKEVEPVETNEIEIIEPGEFDEYGYDSETYYYYSDGVLADTRDNVVEDLDDLIGYEAIDKLVEGDEDCVYVRNHRHELDIEILYNSQAWKDITIKKITGIK